MNPEEPSANVPSPPPGYSYDRPTEPYRFSYPGAAGPRQSGANPSSHAGRGLGAGRVISLSLVSALLAGAVGGFIGYSAANDSPGSDLDPSVSLNTSGLGDTTRPAGSVARVAADVLPTVVSILVRSGARGASGSGFVIRADGYILTNNHVIAGGDGGDIIVTFADGSESDARVVGRTSTYDLAVLRVDRKRLPTSALGNSDSLAVGDPVIAVGSPLGLSGTVTTGIVSALDRPVTAGDTTGDVSFISAIQTDAAINPGNSGGPLVDARGRVVGINSSIATLSAGGDAGNIGLGFAIPINQARRIAEEVIATGVAQYPIVGVNLDLAFAGTGARILDRAQGNRSPLTPGGPAERAGLQPADVITAVDGEPVDSYEEFVVSIRTFQPGDTVTLTVQRAGQELEFDVTLGSTQG